MSFCRRCFLEVSSPGHFLEDLNIVICVAESSEPEYHLHNTHTHFHICNMNVSESCSRCHKILHSSRDPIFRSRNQNSHPSALVNESQKSFIGDDQVSSPF